MQTNAQTNALVHTTTHMHMQHTYMHIQPHTCTHNTMCTQDGHCPLYVASQEGHDGVVEMLLQAEATVDLQDKVEIVTICSCVTCVMPCTLFTVH